MKNIIQVAAAELGVLEFSGAEHNPVIVKYAKESGFTHITDDETPWCSIFINWCCKEANLQRTHKANARSWLSVGKPVDDPVPGDIVVLWCDNPNSWTGHVGLFFGFSRDKSQVFVLGGNQRNSVSVQGFDSAKILGFRRLAASGNLEIPKPGLKLDSRGEEVMKLQRVLIDLGYNCGSIDGVFGPRTEAQLIAFQKQADLQDANGVYEQKTKNKLESIFQS
ncbi:TIGR02594 family protein [Gaoshiqia sediminis]|uniref:TIGR02594 family protein n=1 Tax=Gaoshiqia sediminis TaxID=2986998 RepID=A0AA41YAT7_9BACT|nr:TIGR02594 family protein [Gaoshiqia sediminis]MCW0484582.1 TIGR02594 family protein [Gaoshiqia sediminis]